MTIENENMDNLDALEQEEQEEQVETMEDNETPEVSAEEIAELRKQAELAKNYKIRAEKAEKKAKTAVKTETKSDNDLSSSDLLAMMKNDITEQEDIDYVTQTAKGFGMSVAEAVKDPVIKAKLDERVESRTTASATDTKGGRRGTAKVSDDTLLSNADKGNMPESDRDMERLIKARLEKRRR